MAFSSGSRSLIGEALSWAVASVILAVGFTHYTELKALTANALGVVMPPQEAQAPQEKPQGSSTRKLEIRAAQNGHFYAEAEVNGRPIDVLVDTGATSVALTYEDAARAGLSLRASDFTGRVSTANGIARVAPVRLDRIELGGILIRDVDATVSERGRLEMTLLGMTFLTRLKRVDMRQNLLVLAE